MRIVVEVDPQLHQAVRVKAAQEGRTIASVARELLATWASRDKAQELDKTARAVERGSLSKAAQAKGRMGR